MSFNRLVITVGGLCLYVKGNNGLYVLMPNVSSPHGPPHCPMLVADGAYTETGVRRVYPLKKELDLSYVAPPSPDECDLSWTLNASGYTGGRRVDGKYITQPPAGPLACRIRLPRGLCPQPETKRGVLKVEGFPNISVAGIATIDITVTDDRDGLIHIPGGGTLRAQGQRIEFTLVNIPRGELDWTGGKEHDEDDVADHYQAYFTLLQGNPQGPRIRIGEHVPGDPNGPPILPCFDNPTDLPKPPAPSGSKTVEWVDTHTCSSGSADA